MIRQLKKRLPKRIKLGHLGTLDPMATGVLPIALGNATRIIPWMDQEGKTYLAQMTLGGFSDTEDAWGQITPTGNTQLDLERLHAAFQAFTGTIQQVPPMYSAVHHEGRRLYELARQGQTVDRPARQVHIDQIRFLSAERGGEWPVVTMEVNCSAGTYIRSLCRDIGEVLGTGAYLSGLVRTRSGIFTLETACSLDEIQPEAGGQLHGLLPMDYPLRHWNRYEVTSRSDEDAFYHGRSVDSNLELPIGWLLVYDRSGDLLAIARAHTGAEGTVLKPTRVFKNNTRGSHLDEHC